MQDMREAWDSVELIIPNIPYHQGAKGWDHSIDEWWDPTIGNYLNWHFRTRNVDVFLVNYTYLSRALEYAPKSCLKILDTHDKFGDRRILLESLGLGAEFFHTTVGDEAWGVSRADIIIAIKEQEELYFREISEKEVITIPYFEELRTGHHRNREELIESGCLNIGIIGARNNINFKNISAFLNVALPLFRSYMAPIRVILAGGMCRDLEHYSSDPYTRHLGYVEDVQDFYDQVDAVVVPMEMSSGQKIKVGEALSTGLPVFSHEHAFEGYRSGSSFHKYTSFTNLAKELLELSFSPEKLKDVRDASTKSFELQKAYFESSISKLFGEIYEQNPAALFSINLDMVLRAVDVANIISMIKLTKSLVNVVVHLSGVPTAIHDELLKTISSLTFVVMHGSQQSSTLFDDHNVKLAWCYGEKNLREIAEREIQAFVVPSIINVIKMEAPVEIFQGDTGIPIYIGRVQIDDQDCMLTQPSLQYASAFASAEFDILWPNCDAELNECVAIIVTKEQTDWLIMILNLLRQVDKKALIYSKQEDIEFIQTELKRIMPSLASSKIQSLEMIPGCNSVSIDRIIQLKSDDHDISTFIDVLRAKMKCGSKDGAIWRFPVTEFVRPLHVIVDLADYLERKNIWGPANIARHEDEDGYSFLYNMIKLIAFDPAGSI